MPALLLLLLLLLSLAPVPARAAEADALRQSLRGVPVIGSGGQRIGTVGDLAVDIQGRVVSVLVTVEGSDRTLPVPWEMVRPQVGAAVLQLPWNAATLGWLLGPPPRSLK